MKHLFLLFLALMEMSWGAPAHGQILHAKEPLPSFEVVSIRPWKPSSRPVGAPAPVKVDPVRRVPALESDHVHFIGQIDLLLMEAYRLPIGSDKRILKGPPWVDSEANRYEIRAKIDASMFAAMKLMSAEQRSDQLARLEQSLLAERFHLRVHFAMRGEAPVYALTVAKGGLKMSPSKDGEPTELSFAKNEITAQAVTLDQFASSPLWTPVGSRFVVNDTGLTGAYDFKLKWMADPLEESSGSLPGDDLPPLFDAIREQLGLKVVDSKAPLEVIVIDHIERPTRN